MSLKGKLAHVEVTDVGKVRDHNEDAIGAVHEAALERGLPVIAAVRDLEAGDPALGIDAFVRHVGVNAQGDMATPGNFTDVGWYKYGTIKIGNGTTSIAHFLCVQPRCLPTIGVIASRPR